MQLDSSPSGGAHFTGVGVKETTGEIGLCRMLGVFVAGRMLNATGARLSHHARQDPAGAHAVHADIPKIDALLLAEFDSHANVRDSKGACEYPITLDKILTVPTRGLG